jgi:ATP-dependent Lon protease
LNKHIDNVMTDFLPLFPLQLVVFPGEKLNLHIFEPRYKQLIREVEQNGTTFGIPSYIDGKVMDVGTEIRLISVEKRYEDGQMDIRTEGIGLFRIIELYRVAPGKLYAGADISRLNIADGGNISKAEEILSLAKELFALLGIDKKLPGAGQFYAFDIAHHIGFSQQQEYTFLCLSDEERRQDFMLTHLRAMLPAAQQMQQLRERALMNGHFREIHPPSF